VRVWEIKLGCNKAAVPNCGRRLTPKLFIKSEGELANQSQSVQIRQLHVDVKHMKNDH